MRQVLEQFSKSWGDEKEGCCIVLPPNVKDAVRIPYSMLAQDKDYICLTTPPYVSMKWVTKRYPASVTGKVLLTSVLIKNICGEVGPSPPPKKKRKTL